MLRLRKNLLASLLASVLASAGAAIRRQRSLLPVPLTLAVSLTFVYLASANFDAQDFALEESNAKDEQCVTTNEPTVEQSAIFDSIAHLPASESTLVNKQAQNQVLNASCGPNGSADFWANLWPRRKAPPRG